jgi:hypothetical protein
MRDLGIYIKGFEKMFDRFEEVEQGIIAAIHSLGDLMHLRVRRMPQTETQEGLIRQVGLRGPLVLPSQVGTTRIKDQTPINPIGSLGRHQIHRIAERGTGRKCA